MTDIKKLKKGSSSSFFRNSDIETIKRYSELKIQAMEISSDHDYYLNTLKLSERADEYKKASQEYGVDLWSIHLPFSERLDISNPCDEDRDYIIKLNEKLITDAALAGIKVAVLHPSSEPISDDKRQMRFDRSRSAIEYLNKIAKRNGVILAIENLPRTCLCNRSEEMIKLLSGIDGITVCFDTNHSLYEDNICFLNNLISNNLKIQTLHISDYDGIDERHRLPGDGINKWSEMLSVLANSNYSGPLMYEISAQPRERDPIPDTALSENMELLVNNKL
ncbi:sugar phosphate isomerase/epimerase [Eubacteriales bacterium OttesenSCG-928-G02]|nr:sugar phosphate isomerase/epimerase [Eubacteriales bacterium OttesenSCG-928-G02]